MLTRLNRLRHPRGNALIVTMIALAVLLVLVVGAIKFTGTNREAAIAKVKGDEMGACADTARTYLLSRLRTFGVPVAGLTLNQVVLPDDTLPAQMMTAHYGSTAPTPSIVALAASSMGASRRQARDMANNLGPATLGGQYYRVVVKCREPNSNRESELEFVFRHGI